MKAVTLPISDLLIEKTIDFPSAATETEAVLTVATDCQDDPFHAYRANVFELKSSYRAYSAPV